MVVSSFKAMMRTRRSIAFSSFVGGKTIGLALCLLLGSAVCVQPEPVTVGGRFTLSAPDGRTVTDRSFAGRWLLVYFGYTACPDSCPTALADIAQSLARLGDDARQVQAIFITLDPRHDTPKVMGDYAGSFDPRILGLTGTQDQIDAVARAYGAYALPHDPEATRSNNRLDHSVYIYLMDPRGAFIRAFDPSWSPDRMAEAVRGAISAGGDVDRHSELTKRP